jgi:hypothetical protein
MTDGSARPDKGTRIYLGCSVAFLSLFLAVGLFVLGVVVLGDTPDARPALVVGLAFVVVPIGGLLMVRWVWRQAALREQRRQQSPDQPWAWKQDVGTGVITGTSPTGTILVWVLFAGFWLGMVTLVTAVAWDRIREEIGLAVFMGGFWLAGLFLAGMAVNAILHARRFGRSTLALDTTPARLGGWLSGVVRAPLAVQDAELQLTVECVRTTHSRASTSGSSTSKWTMWRTTKLIDGTRCPRQAEHVEIPFAVRLPTDADATREHNDNLLASVLGTAEVNLIGTDMDWYVGVTGKLRGVDYSDRFAVPVAPAEGAPAGAHPPREMPELSGEALAERLPGRLEYRTDADVFVFPVKPSWLVWTAIFAGVALLPFFGGVPLLAQVPPGVIKWAAVICGGLAALSLVGLMLDTRSIEVAPQAVRVRRGVLGIGFHRTIPRADIAEVEEESSRSDPPSYAVNIKTRDGTTYWAAMALREADQAAALAARLRQILQLAPRS